MKKMILPFCLMLGVSTIALSQSDDDTHVGVGIKGGYNYANLSISNDGDIDDKNAVSSFNIGAYVDLPLARVLSIQAGLMLTGKGSSFTYGDKSSGTWYELKTNPLYLELPINIVGKIPLGSNSNIFFGAGPYGAMGIGGKYKVTGQVLGIDYSKEDGIAFSDDDPTNGNNGESGDLKRFDFGLNFLAGIEISHLTLNANYGLGMVNIKPGSNNNDNDKYKNRVFSLSVGYLF